MTTTPTPQEMNKKFEINDHLTRCPWCFGNQQELDYHDREWGTPLHNDRRQFEYLSYEVMQCGLSFALIMKRREVLRQCFADFDYERVAQFTDANVERIMATPGMIKSRPKILAIVGNAQAFIKVRQEFGTFSAYIWGFTGGKTLIYRSHVDQSHWVTQNELSQSLARDMKRRGFKFLGPVVLYSHLQATGQINDHTRDCFRFKQVLTGPTPVQWLD